MLRCPVRDCHKSLLREERRVVCPQGHSFDIARAGYLNLLQPGERRSRHPGDSKAAVLARRRLYGRGIGTPFLQAVMEVLRPNSDEHVLDIGCGEGFYGGNLAEQTGCQTHGIDISTTAVDEAARRYRAAEWIVANADRFVPYDDAAFHHLLSVTARMNAPEFRRVLKRNGKLLVAVPGPDDLIELRGIRRDRLEQTTAAFASNFALLEHRRVMHQQHLDAEAITDLLLTVYRPMTKRQEAPSPQVITFSLDLLLFEPS